MKLLPAIQHVPIAMDPERGAELANAWGATGPLADLLTGIGGSSPFLFQVLNQEQAWVQDAVTDADPLSKLGLDVDDAAKTLRRAKHRVAGYLAMGELSHAMPLTTTTSALTQFADQSVELAFTAALRPFQARGKVPEDVQPFILAMGKMGAGELNYSSDIDLIVLFDDSRFDLLEAQSIRSQLVKVTRIALKTLSDVTADGYVFRTDVRLRPDPSVTPICTTTSQALQYYESLGRTWERAAFIKARVCAGDLQAGQAFLDQMQPFVWRRYLDFAAIEEAHDLRLKIRTHKGLGGPIALPGHDIKLGRGGIREIEFFTQTRQLISGGRDPSLRDCRTLPALAALAKAGWVEADTQEILTKHYTRHRHIEHALQMVRDAQTQSMPHSEAGIARIAALLGQTPADFAQETEDALAEVHNLTEAFFEPTKAEDAELHFDHAQITDQWPHYPALRSDRATELFENLRPTILSKLGQAANPEEALRHFDNFLKGLPAGVQVFSLFAANPKLVDLITDIAAISPALASYLGRNARVMDAVISGAFFAPWPEPAALEQALDDVMTRAGDYESGLIAARAWAKEMRFQTGVHLLQNLITPGHAARQYCDIANAVLRVLLPKVQAEFAVKHGTIARSSTAVLAMGSLGAGQLTSQSDLDLMVIFDADVDAYSDGRKSLAARQYFGRLTQALITALAAPMPEGQLFEVDMRLRPSGKAGPVATRLEGFDDYQKSEAWTWEHLALTRARVAVGEAGLAQKIEDVQADVISNPKPWAEIAADVTDMRQRLAADKPALDEWDLKRGPGGLQDIELLGQALALFSGQVQGQTVQQIESSDLTDDQKATLSAAYHWMFDLRICHILLCHDGAKVLAMGDGGWKILATVCGVSNLAEMVAKISETRAKAAAVIDAVLGQD